MYITKDSKILVSDFDFTLCEHGNPHITAENYQAVQRWRKNGNVFIIASGRSYTSMALVMENRSIADYADFLILNDGATIISATGEKVYTDRMNNKLVDDFKDALLNLHLRGKHAAISYYGNHELCYIKPGCCKFRLWFEYEEDCRVVEKLITERFSKRLQTIAYHNVAFNHDTRLSWVDDSLHHTLEVNNSGVDKKSALDYLLGTLCVNNAANRVIAIGDDKNDLRMLEAYNGYTLEHAREEVLKRIPSAHIVRHLHNLITDQLRAPA